MSDEDILNMSENSGDIIVSSYALGEPVYKNDLIQIHFTEDEPSVTHVYRVKNIIINNVYLEYVQQIEDNTLLEAGFFDKLKNLFNKPVDLAGRMNKAATKNSERYKKALEAAMKAIADEYGPKGREYTYYLQKQNGNYLKAMNQDKARAYYKTILDLATKSDGDPKEVELKTAPIANAVVVDKEGMIIRRGLELVKGRELFDPTNIQIRQGYSYPENAVVKIGKVDGATNSGSKKSDKTSEKTTSDVGIISSKIIEKTKKLLRNLEIEDLLTDDDESVEIDSLTGKTAYELYFSTDGGTNKILVSDFISDATNDKLLTESVLTESPVVKLSDDDYNNPETVDLRHNLDTAIQAEKEQEQAKIMAAKQEDLRKKYQPAIDQLERDIQNKTDPQDALSNIFDMLVPSSGPAETVAGELVRATMRLLYRDYNDGDKFFEGYGIETCGSSAEYLYDNGFDSRIQSILDDAISLSDDDESYTEMLDALAEDVLNHIYKNQTLFVTENNEDSRDYSAEYISENQPTYEYVIEAPYEVAEILDKGLATAWDLNSYVEENIEYETTMSGCEVERPWSHSSTNVTISNLTRDGYETAERIFDDDFWKDFISEYEDELSDEEEYDEDQFDSDDNI
jgi:hypothetical protein